MSLACGYTNLCTISYIAVMVLKDQHNFHNTVFFLLTIYPFKTSHCLPFMFIVYLLKHSSLIAGRIALILILLLDKHRPKYLFKLLHVFILPTET